MIHVIAETANQAWQNVFMTLISKGSDSGNDKYIRDEVALIEITDPQVLPADPRFPMEQEHLDVINDFIHSGKNEDKVVHEWTKIYHHRAFDEPNSQIEFMIENLKSEKPVGGAQISMWDKNIDQHQDISPCTQIIWARIKHGKLELHVHAHSSDAYKKLLMNILEFISLQYYIADRVGVPVGRYIHFLDSCHLHNLDTDKITRLTKELHIK